MRRARIVVGSTLAVAMLAAVALGQGAPGTSGNPIKAKTSATAGFAPRIVTIANNGTARRPTVVFFRNVDRLRHNAVATRRIRGNAAFRSGNPTTANFRLRLPAGRRGTFAYICEVHPFMRGTLVLR